MHPRPPPAAPCSISPFSVLVPGLVAALFLRPAWRQAWLVMLLTMLVDVDHLLATPIYDPNRWQHRVSSAPHRSCDRGLRRARRAAPHPPRRCRPAHPHGARRAGLPRLRPRCSGDGQLSGRAAARWSNRHGLSTRPASEALPLRSARRQPIPDAADRLDPRRLLGARVARGIVEALAEAAHRHVERVVGHEEARRPRPAPRGRSARAPRPRSAGTRRASRILRAEVEHGLAARPRSSSPCGARRRARAGRRGRRGPGRPAAGGAAAPAAGRRVPRTRTASRGSRRPRRRARPRGARRRRARSASGPAAPCRPRGAARRASCRRPWAAASRRGRRRRRWRGRGARLLGVGRPVHAVALLLESLPD